VLLQAPVAYLTDNVVNKIVATLILLFYAAIVVGLPWST
jgi:hypothetical protein